MTPHASSDLDGCSRRSFLRTSCLLGSMLAVGVPLATALGACDSAPGDGGTPPSNDGITISGSTITIDTARAGGAALAANGGFLYLASAGTVVVNDGGTIRAFSSECPHEGNAVSQFSGGQFVCPAHGSRFATSGAVVTGPARRGLTPFTATRSGTLITITKS